MGPPLPSTDLLGLVAHDLRGPLAGIRGLAEHVADRYGPSLPGEAREDLAMIVEESRRVSLLAEDLLTLARAHGQPLEREAVDVREVVEDVLARLRDQLARGGASVQVEAACCCYASRRAMGQILQNLVENAVRHGGEAPRVVVRCELAERELRIDVMDDGPGIPPERREEVRRPFTQLDGAGTGRGSGLGLAIADALAERHGGALEIGDGPLGGACVTVRLPQRG